MNITKINNKFNLELSQHELNCLFTISAHVATGKDNDIGNVNFEFYKLAGDAEAKNLGRAKILHLAGYWDGLDFSHIVFEESKPVNTPNRDKNGKFLTTKKNIRFDYPGKYARNYSPPYAKSELDRREILNFKKENGYLTGIDKRDNKFKKFDLKKVSNIRYF